MKLALLVGIFVALPVILYVQAETADRETRALVTRVLQRQSLLIAQALKPLLDAPDRMPGADLNATLQQFGEDGTILQLILRPAAAAGSQTLDNFYYVASAPSVDTAQLGPQLDSMARHGVLQQVAQTCTWDQPVDIRYSLPNGREEILTSIIPITTRWGCWVLVSSHSTAELLDTSVGRSYWKTPEIRMAAIIFAAGVLLAVLISVSVWRNISHFRTVARQIREGRTGENYFATQKIIPELVSVAADVDHLVIDLREAARTIRQSAENNAHSFNGPRATNQSSVATLRRAGTADNEKSQRALALIDSSLGRLKALVTASQRLDINAANLIEAARTRVDLTRVVADLLLFHRGTMIARQIRLARHLDGEAVIDAAAGVIEIVVENILDNAISFSPPGGTITVSLVKSGRRIDLYVEDEGPGIDPTKISQIFDRYFSLRPDPQPVFDDDGETPAHAGLGLWIARQNTEALGGTIQAVNRTSGGLSVHVSLPAAIA